MKQIIFTCCLFAFALMATTAVAQVQTPAPSPSCKIEQMVGLTNVTIEYSRPSVKDRKIFGGLVPYGEVWRTGANAATKITFDKDVKLGGQEVKGGSYALLSKPDESEWKFMLYPYESGSPNSYMESEVEPIMFTGESQSMSDVKVESFMIMIDQLTNSSASLVLAWDNLVVGVPLEVHTDKDVEASIESTLAGPSMQDYFASASYYHSEGKDLNKALKWINKAIDMGYERYWVLRTKSLIQADLGDKAGAIESAKKSLEMAKEAGNNDYIRMNEASIKEWMD
ncbi:MAG: DUF2911 domain-containing protein [Saprospiraceae bacterium]|nr:DUF2911 domain-containing protein [Saprospiraceae bacterium]